MDPVTQKPGKSMNKSVPSIAVRFHCGDEDLDIYPSADDEDDEAKDEDTPSAPSEPPTTSRDHSPIKEYFKGLGKRSTSVDSSMDAPAAPAGGGSGGGASDTWRKFHELRGKITKTVEEKLTEMKAERKTSATASPQLSTSRRIRGGADEPSPSESEESESLAVESVTTEENVATGKKAKKATKKRSSRDMQASRERRESQESRDLKPSKESKESKLEKKRRKAALKNISNELTSTDEDELVEAAVEAAESTSGLRFLLPDDLDENADTVDFRTSPPTAYFREKRRSHMFVPPPERRLPRLMRWFWRARWLMAFLVGLAAYIACPLNTFANGILTGVMLTLGTHFTVGLSGWLEPEDVTTRQPFMVPNYASFAPLETPADNEDAHLSAAKCAGWMNELPYDYNPETYHINHTQTVYVRLEGSTLIISHPKNKVQKRATWDERKYKLKFVHQRIYDLNGCELRLMPEGLTRRRIWSKKYPLCLVLPKGSFVSKLDLTTTVNEEGELVFREPDMAEETARVPAAVVSTESMNSPAYVHGSEIPFSALRTPNTSRSSGPSRLRVAPVPVFVPSVLEPILGDDTDVNYDPGITDSSTATCIGSVTDLGGPHITFGPLPGTEDDFFVVDEVTETCLYLFARADRQKEDWYRRLQIAIRYSGCVPEERPFPSDASLTCSMVGSNVSVATTATTATTATAYNESGMYRNFSTVTCPANEFNYELGRPGSDQLVFGAASDIAARHYLEFMARFPVQIPRPGAKKSPTLERVEREVDCDVLWFNAMLGHILYDLMASPDVIDKCMQKIQKKLDIIKLPYFIENLVLSDLDLGRDVPLIHRASRPVLDEHGLWVDLDISFEGCIRLTIETKLNLMKLKVRKDDPDDDGGASPPDVNSPPPGQEPSVEQAEGAEGVEEQEGAPSGEDAELKGTESKHFSRLASSKLGSRLFSVKSGAFLVKSASTANQQSASNEQPASSQQLSAIYNSDIEDSAETSETETDTKSAPTSDGGESGQAPRPGPLKTPESPAKPGPPGSKGMTHLMNRFVASNFFQQATENRYIKRAMEGVSKTVITLQVEIRAISGQLAVNLPPPPSDRIWYGFRGAPNIWIKARPKFGDRSVSMHRIVTFIEKKIVQELEKKIVLPNMDDLVIPPMTTQLP